MRVIAVAAGIVILCAGTLRAEEPTTGEEAVGEERASSKETTAVEGGAAGSTDDESIEELYHAGEVVITGRRPPSIEQAATVSVIDREEIIAHGDRTLADALGRVPGIQVYKHRKGQLRLRMRGFDLDRVMILIDSVPINDVYSTEADLAAIPLVNVSRIIINRGVSSALYGSDGAVGSINVITAKPTAPFGEVFLEWGPFNNTALELSQGAALGDLYYQITGMLGHSDGRLVPGRLDAETRREWFDKIIRYDLYPLEGPFGEGAPYHTFSDVTFPAKDQYLNDVGLWDHERFTKYQLTFRGGYRFDTRAEVGLTTDYYYYYGRTNSYEPVAHNSYRGDRWKPNWPYFGDDSEKVKKFGLRNRAFVWPEVSRLEVGPYLRLHLGDLEVRFNGYYLRKKAEQLGYASTDHAYFKGETSLFKPRKVFDPFYDIKTFDSTGFRLLASYEFARWHRLGVGLHYRYDSYVGAERALSAERSPTIYASMGNREYAVERLAAHTFSLGLEDELFFFESLRVSIGVSYDSQSFTRFMLRSDGVMTEAYRPKDDAMLFGTRDAFNPVLGATWEALDDLLELRLAGALKTRFPTLGEYAKIETAELDHGLEPERIYHVNAGFGLFCLDRRLSLRADWFGSIVDDRIVKLAKEEPPVNADRVTATGVESSAEVLVGRLGSLAELRFLVGYTFTRSRNRDYSDDATVNKGRIVPFSPAHQLLADLRVGFASETALDIWVTSYIEQYVYAMHRRPTELESPYSTSYFEPVRLHDPVLLNVRLSQRFGTYYEAALSVVNLLDDYLADPFNPGYGRTVFISLRAHWQ